MLWSLGETHDRDVDRLARDLAAGGVSRRTALRRLAGIGLGILAPGALAGAAQAGGGCPDGRVKCDGRCCPRNAKCRQGKCKCKKGYEKCGKKCCSVCGPGETFCSGACVDTSSDANNCGTCGHQCQFGEVCFAGICTT